MIKKLLTIATVILTVSVNAQSNGKSITPVISEVASTNELNNEAASIAAPGCATIQVINTGSNVSMYTVSSSTTAGCSPNAGYLFGKNCYGFKEHATWFSAASIASVTSPSILAVSVAFYHSTVTNKGTKGTGNVGLKIYTGTSNTLPPGTIVTQTTAPLTAITAAQTGTSALFFYTFTLTPTAVSAGGFYASVVTPTAIGDTTAIYSQTASSSAVSSTPNAWELDNTLTWSDVATDWGLNSNLVIYPILCGTNITTGISNNLGLSKNVRIMPNPSTGLVNLVVTLAQTENLDVTITNALGQQVLSNKYNGISNELISLDLNNQSNGVYFVTVSNGKDKMVQRLIINK